MRQMRDAIPALPGNSIKDRIQQIKTLLHGVRPKNGHSLILARRKQAGPAHYARGSMAPCAQNPKMPHNKSESNRIRSPGRVSWNGMFWNGMFWDASTFNDDVSGWDISGVTLMHGMFFGATSFDQDLSDWDPPNGTWYVCRLWHVHPTRLVHGMACMLASMPCATYGKARSSRAARWDGYMARRLFSIRAWNRNDHVITVDECRRVRKWCLLACFPTLAHQKHVSCRLCF